MGHTQTELLKGSFTLICGRTGSGKTTLLKSLKESWKDAAGFVFQNPDNQIVADTVREELSYGPANQGLPEALIRSRIAETASYFGISRWMDRKTDTLSGGEKQILNLASVMAMNPEYLLLDEPTSMLDPVMATRLIEIVLRIHRELGTTIILAEHRPDDLFGVADQVVWMEKGEILAEGTPGEVAARMVKEPELGLLLPTATRLCSRIPSADPLPLTVAEGRTYLQKHPNKLIDEEKLADVKYPSQKLMAAMRDVTFAYEKYGRKVLSHASLELFRGEILSLLGENGSGKTTAALLMGRRYRPYSGRIINTSKNMGMLFQDVTVHFTRDSYEGKHPYDYSGGEQQLLALKLVLEKNPDFLILDEPTKGLDAVEKEKLAARLTGLKKNGMTMMIITHDIAFASMVSDRMALLFDGGIACCKTPAEFCRDNLFYTTPQKRLFGREGSGV